MGTKTKNIMGAIAEKVRESEAYKTEAQKCIDQCIARLATKPYWGIKGLWNDSLKQYNWIVQIPSEVFPGSKIKLVLPTPHWFNFNTQGMTLQKAINLPEGIKKTN